MGRWLVLVAVGCGRDVCERSAQADEDCGVDVSPEAVDACQDGLAGCTRDDEDQIEAWFDCTEDAGALACEPTTSALEAGLVCIANLDGVSDACDVSRTGTF